MRGQCKVKYLFALLSMLPLECVSVSKIAVMAWPTLQDAHDRRSYEKSPISELSMMLHPFCAPGEAEEG